MWLMFGNVKIIKVTGDSGRTVTHARTFPIVSNGAYQEKPQM